MTKIALIISVIVGFAFIKAPATHHLKTDIQQDHFNDSLRQVLLNQKDNEALKGSFLEELYIRGVVEPKKNQLFFEIPFNLHGYDCGAPDCYENKFEFRINWNLKSFEFPDSLWVADWQTGCLDHTVTTKNFIKTAENETNVIYYAPSDRQHLVLGSADSKVGYALCFDDTDPGFINLNNLTKRTLEPKKESDAPFRSTQTEAFDYGLFIR
jgi:hypothetical protein